MRKLIAVWCALLLACAVGIAWYVQAPTDAALLAMVREKPVNARPAQPLWGSPSLLAEMVKTQEAEGWTVGILLGSSELSQTSIDSAHPVKFFSENNLGFSLIALGGGGFQSLWSAIEVAALDECGALADKKVALLIGDQWFMNPGGCTTEAFLNSFSDEAFAECMQNSGLTQETKDKICQRAQELGVDAQTIKDLSDTSLVARVNRGMLSLVQGGERREGLAEGLELNAACGPYGTDVAEPEWKKLDERAVVEGEAACTNNRYGIYDDYFNTYVKDKPWGENYDGEPFAAWSDTEFSDLRLFLAVCNELDIEPLLVIEPVNGVYYDFQPYTKESREKFYSQLRTVLDEAEVEYLDLSSHDYDKYYLRDVMHLGWRSWVQVDKALYKFFKTDSMTGSTGKIEAEVQGDTLDSPGVDTAAERDANATAEEMLEVEGAGKEAMEAEEDAS